MSGAASGVRPEQRYNASRPCPICGGHASKPRGIGERCVGFLSDGGEWARCSREEHAGAAPWDDKTGAYVHKLTGDCKCGARHGFPTAGPPPNGERNGRREKRGRIVKTYDYPDERGSLLYQTVRLDPKDFRQRQPDGRGGWIWSLKGARLVLYRFPELLEAGRGQLTLACAGEKDTDTAADKLGFLATTNPLGEGKWKHEYSDPLRGRPVAIIAHNDEAGRKHAEDVARSLYGKASSVKIINLPGVPEGGGDLTDWRDAGGTREELERLIDEAPEWTPPEERDDGRYMLGDDWENDIEPPAELVPDIILEGRSHVIYSGPGLGKTFVMLWLILRVLERGAPVLLYDKENGKRIIRERLKALGADGPTLNRLLYYYPDPSLPTTEEGRQLYEARLDRIKPALVCFDSWIGFLAGNGLDENASNDIATFAAHYIHPARIRGVATLMLDHVPKDGTGARGSGRKKDEVDVMWNLRSLRHFDRERTGQITLRREKDREGWLPVNVVFSVGGDGSGGLVFSRSAGTFEAEGSDGLKPSERKTLQALEPFTATGARAKDWQTAAEKLDVKERSFWNAVKSLQRKGRVFQRENLYFPFTAKDCNGTAMQSFAVDPNTTALHCTPPIGVQACSTGAEDDDGMYF